MSRSYILAHRTTQLQLKTEPWEYIRRGHLVRPATPSHQYTPIECIIVILSEN
jgi:hypothetical protein